MNWTLTLPAVDGVTPKLNIQVEEETRSWADVVEVIRQRAALHAVGHVEEGSVNGITIHTEVVLDNAATARLLGPAISKALEVGAEALARNEGNLPTDGQIREQLARADVAKSDPAVRVFSRQEIEGQGDGKGEGTVTRDAIQQLWVGKTALSILHEEIHDAHWVDCGKPPAGLVLPCEITVAARLGLTFDLVLGRAVKAEPVGTGEMVAYGAGEA